LLGTRFSRDSVRSPGGPRFVVRRRIFTQLLRYAPKITRSTARQQFPTRRYYTKMLAPCFYYLNETYRLSKTKTVIRYNVYTSNGFDLVRQFSTNLVSCSDRNYYLCTKETVRIKTKRNRKLRVPPLYGYSLRIRALERFRTLRDVFVKPSDFPLLPNISHPAYPGTCPTMHRSAQRSRDVPPFNLSRIIPFHRRSVFCLRPTRLYFPPLDLQFITRRPF